MDVIQLTPSGLIVAGIPWLEVITVKSNPAVPSLAFPDLTSLGKLQISGNTTLASVDLNSLVSVVGTMDFSGYGGPGNPALATLSLNALEVVGLTLDLRGSGQLVSLSLPSVVTISTGSNRSYLTAENCPMLANVSFPNYLPTNGKRILFMGCALTEASVDHILARAVANPAYVTGTVNLGGGLNAAPGAPGQIDKATLIARGVNVSTN